LGRPFEEKMMPWEVMIRKPRDEALGCRAEVVRWIAEAVPAIGWVEDPPLLDQIKDMPEHSFHNLLPTWPEETRAYFSQPHLRGDYLEGDLSIRLYGFEAEPLKCVHVEVRGNGNPLALLAAICVGHGWVVIDSDVGTPVDLTAGAASGWEEFRQYRDRAVGMVHRPPDEVDPA
jgi:hypothetical protein